MNKINVRKVLLEVYADVRDDGTPIVNWEYGEGLKCWSLVGVLETIKKELLDTVDDASREEYSEDY
ncbi:MAG: hypothetical protein M0R03_23565 [Novosphingobium sp.]|nr:hypothetical protein [Novosphingobium sp.]